MKARNENLLGRLQNLPPATATVIGLLYLAVVAIADYYAPPEMRFALFYLIGVLFIGWCTGPWLTIAVVTLGSGLGLVHGFTIAHPNYSIGIMVWNDSARFLFLAASGWLAARASNLTRRLSGLVEERTATLRMEADHHKLTAATLAATVERFEQVVNNIAEVFWLSDVSQNQIIFASPGYERVWGRKCEELYRDPRSWVAAVHPDDREQISRRSLTDQVGGCYDVEYRIIRPDGAVRWIWDRAFPVRNPQGEVHRIVGIAEDITERRATRVQLERQAAILENMAEAALMTDDQGTIVLTNPALDQQLGYEPGELMGKPLAIIAGIPPQEQQRVFQAAVERVRTVGPIHEEYLARRKDGSLLDIEARGTGATVGGCFGMVIVGQDITQRKRAEQALRQSEETLRVLLNAITDPAFLLDKDGDVLVHNPALASALGVAGSDLRGKNMSDILPAELARERQSMFEQTIRNRQPVRSEAITHGRTYMNVVNPVLDAAGDVTRVAVFALDITDRKLAEAALREVHEKLEQRVQERTTELEAANKALAESEARLRLALDASNAGIWSWDSMSNDTTWDDRFHQHYGLGPQIPKSFDTWINHMHPNDRPRLLERVQALLAPGGENVWNEEFRALHPSMGERWMVGLGRLERDETGRAMRITGINLDITERKRAEEAQRAQLAYIQTIYQNAPVGLCVLNLEFRFVRINERLAAMNGIPVDQHLGRHLRDIVPHMADEIEAVCRQVIASGQPVLNLEVEGVTAAQSAGIRTWLSSWVPLKEADGRVTGISLLVEEVTERKRMLEALREAHDMLETRVKERTAQLQAANAALAESEERYRSLVTNLNVGVYRSTPARHGGFLHANPALARMHGYDSVEEFQKVRVADLFQDPREREVFLRELMGQGTLHNYEVRLKQRDGTPIYASVNATPHRGPNGEVDWIDGMIDDITERKRSQEALRASEERYRTLAESSPDAIFILDRDIRVQYVNSTAAALWRRQPQDLIGLTQAELFPTETAQNQSRVVRSVFETGEPVHRDKPLAFPVGDHWIEIRLAPLRDAQGTVTSVMGISRDITARKQAEQQLAETLDLNQKMMAASTLGIAAYKTSGECVFANEALARILGGSMSDVLQGDFRQLTLWRESGMLQQADEALGQGQTRSMEILGTTCFGKSISLDCHVAPFVSNGQPHVLVMAMDISERKRTEEALKMHSSILQNMAEGTLLTAPDQSILFANSALEAMFGYEPGELKEKPVSVLNAWSPEETEHFNHVVMRATEGGEVWQGQYQNRRKDGTVFTSESRVIRLALDGKDHFISVQQDITERKRAESLLQAQRDLAVSFSLTSDLKAGLNRLLEIIVQMGGVDSGSVHLLNQATGELDLVAQRGGSSCFVKAVSHWSPDSPQMRLLLKGRPVFSLHRDLPIQHDEIQQREGMRAAAIIPLSYEGNIFGALALASHVADEIPRQTQLALEAIAAQAAGAIARTRAEEALRESENRLRAIISNAPVLLFAVDQDGIIRFEDGQALNALGATRGANLGRSVMKVYAHFPILIENARRALRGEEFEAIVEAGPTIFDCWYSPTRDKDGRSTGYIGVATNISERHRLERQILEISDREHARIGQDIHDGLCQHLVSLALDANSLRGELAGARRPEAKKARRIADYLDLAITEARQLSRGLFPVRLAREGLPPALEELAAATRDRFKIRCRFASKGLVAVESSVMATHLYRIAQEAVSNAIKHSRASSIAIGLCARAGVLELSVTDNGEGLSAARRKESTGMGLNIMDYRSRSIGGTLQVGPGRRGGTRVSCCVPAPASGESSV